jgi:hypothetical protein
MPAEPAVAAAVITPGRRPKRKRRDLSVRDVSWGMAGDAINATALHDRHATSQTVGHACVVACAAV